MIVIAGFILGGIWGGLWARRRQGNRADIAQYAAAMAILGTLIGLFVTIAIDRMV